MSHFRWIMITEYWSLLRCSINDETKNVPIRGKLKAGQRICQTAIIFRRFLFSMDDDGTRGKVKWRLESTNSVRARGQPLTWKIGLADELLWLTRAACVSVLWMTGDDDWRCGDSSEWVNNPVQLPAGSYPGPGTLYCEPGPVPWWPLAAPCVYWGGPGTRRLSLIKGQWWLLIRDKSTWIVLKSRPDMDLKPINPDTDILIYLSRSYLSKKRLPEKPFLEKKHQPISKSSVHTSSTLALSYTRACILIQPTQNIWFRNRPQFR